MLNTTSEWQYHVNVTNWHGNATTSCENHYKIIEKPCKITICNDHFDMYVLSTLVGVWYYWCYSIVNQVSLSTQNWLTPAIEMNTMIISIRIIYPRSVGWMERCCICSIHFYCLLSHQLALPIVLDMLNLMITRFEFIHCRVNNKNVLHTNTLLHSKPLTWSIE